MAKYSPRQKLDTKTQQRLLLSLCKAIVAVKKPQEAASLLADLLGSQELLMIAKRLQIAKMLIQGTKYSDITKDLKTSHMTVARINLWLNESGEGYRAIIKKCKDSDIPSDLNYFPDKTTADPMSWSYFKRKYPVHFWPEILLEQIIKSANKKHKQKLKNTLAKLSKNKYKKELFLQLENLLSEK